MAAVNVTLEELVKEVRVAPEMLDKRCTHDHLRTVSLFLDWRTVAPHLGLSEIDREEIESNEKKESGKRLKTLEKWKAKFAFRATYRRLIEVLLTTDRADHAEKVCELLKGEYIKSKHHQVLKQTKEIQQKDEVTQRDTVSSSHVKVHSMVQVSATMTDASTQTETVREINGASMQPEVFQTKERSPVATKSTQTEPTLFHCQDKEKKRQASQREINFSQAQLNWERGPRVPQPLQGPATIAVHGSKVYINGKGANVIFEYDSVNNKWLSKMETPRTDFGLAVVRNRLTLVGGNAELQTIALESTFENTYSSWLYSFAANTGDYLHKKYCSYMYGTATNSLLSQELLHEKYNWTEKLPSMPTARANPVLAATDKYLVVTGGSGDRSSIEVMDVDQGQWYTAENIPSLQRYDMLRLVAHEDTLYAIKTTSTNENSLITFTCSLTTLVHSCSSENTAFKPVLWQKAAALEIPTRHSYNRISVRLVPLALQKLGVVVFYEYIHTESGTEAVLHTDVRLFIYDARENQWNKAPAGLCPHCPILDYQNSSIAMVLWNKVVVLGASEHPSQMCDKVIVGRIS